MITCAACGHSNSDDSTFCTECAKPLKVKDGIGTLDTPNPNDLPVPKPSAPMLELEPGSVFDSRYTIVEKIGQGGMGMVYRATEKLGGINREVALKLIRSDLLADSNAVDRLMHEGVLTQALRHDNIVTVYNVGVASEAPYVAMEYVDGISLRDWIRRQRYADMQKDPPPMAVVAALLHSILDGLGAAHLKGVIHRDLKPENVILLADPTPDAAPLKILDFGIARAPGKSEALTGTGLGTAKYMAPEQETDPAGANAASDLYAVSRMFYELLMGVLPRGFWQAPSGGRSDVPVAIDALIQQGLSDSQRLRPQSAADYRAALDKALGGKTPVPRPSPPRPPQPSGKPLNKPLVFGLGGAALLTVVIAAALMGKNYTVYSGQWNFADDAALNMMVNADGSFSGSGYSVGGVPVDVSGSIPDGQLTFSNPQYGQYPGKIAIGSPACHLVFETYNPDGSLNWQDTFHVDHPAGADCPARFGN